MQMYIYRKGLTHLHTVWPEWKDKKWKDLISLWLTWEKKKLVSPTRLEGILFQPIMWQVNRPSTYIFNHMIFLMSYVTFQNTHVDGLFACHIVGWRRIPPNRIRGKLYKKIKKRYGVIEFLLDLPSFCFCCIAQIGRKESEKKERKILRWFLIFYIIILLIYS